MKRLFICFLIFVPFLVNAQRLFDISSMQKPASGPTITLSTTFLNNFTNVTGTASSTQPFTYSSQFLTGNVTVTIPSGFEVSINSGSSYVTTLSLTPIGGVVSGTMLVRVAAATAAGSYSGNISFASTGATTKNVAITATVSSSGTPTITPSPTSLSGFVTTVGSQSSNQTFTVNASNLTTNVVSTAPASYLVSLDGVTYSTSVTLTQTGGTITSQLVYAVISQTASVGSPSGNITLTSTGATTQNVAVSGTVNSSGSVVDSIVAQFFFTSTSTSVSDWVNVAGNPDAAALTTQDTRNFKPVSISFVLAKWKPVSAQHSSSNTGGAASSTTGFPVGAVTGYFYNLQGSFTGWNLANDTNIIISNLDPTQLYQFDMMPSRAATNKLMTMYIADSTNNRVDSVVADAGNNTTILFTMKNKKPDANGIIRLGIWPQYGNGTTGNQFGYMNALRITKQATRLGINDWFGLSLLFGVIGQWIKRRKKKLQKC